MRGLERLDGWLLSGIAINHVMIDISHFIVYVFSPWRWQSSNDAYAPSTSEARRTYPTTPPSSEPRSLRSLPDVSSQNSSIGGVKVSVYFRDSLDGLLGFYPAASIAMVFEGRDELA